MVRDGRHLMAQPDADPFVHGLAPIDRWVAWWNSLTKEQRRDARARAERRKAYWMSRRAAVLFGFLEV